MLLYDHPLSSYAQKVKMALREKGLDFDVETPPALGSSKATGPFAAASPRNEVPALIDGAARIFGGGKKISHIVSGDGGLRPVFPIFQYLRRKRGETGIIADAVLSDIFRVRQGRGDDNR